LKKVEINSNWPNTRRN